jgi:hypothetical protein
MSISESLNQFSVEVVIAAGLNDANSEVLKGLDVSSVFLREDKK